jgi:hypothetical protein
MTVFTDRVDDALRAELPPEGFDFVRARRWVNSRTAPIRRIFEFQALKGATYSARWGFSLDFVPVLQNGRLRWKRTPKSIAFDLHIDPQDELGPAPDWCSLTYIPGYTEPGAKQITRVVADATRAARRDFARVDSIADIISIFNERAQRTFGRFSLENYVQTHIAWGLGLVAIGKSAEGEAHIKLFCTQYGIDRKDSVLRKAENEAVRYARMPSG